MTKSGIEWTDRSDWNPMRGCTRVSEGCRNCYAERIAGRFSAPGQPFHGFATQTESGARWTGRVELIPERLDLPLRWRKPSRIFTNSAFDLFHESVPDEWIDQVFAVMALAQHHTFQVLTKRAARMRAYMTTPRTVEGASWDRWTQVAMGIGYSVRRGYAGSGGVAARPLPNIWLGVSAEDQKRADERIPHLLATPAAVRWVSAEPLLGPVALHHIPDRLGESSCHVNALTGARWYPGCGSVSSQTHPGPRLDWVVAGGESGPGARPMHPAWARSLRDQCAAAGVAFFMKQMSGARKSAMPPIPEDLLIREMPK